MEEIDLANIHMVKKIFKSFKYFIGYITNHIKLLSIKLPQMDILDFLIAITNAWIMMKNC